LEGSSSAVVNRQGLQERRRPDRRPLRPRRAHGAPGGEAGGEGL